MSRPNIFVNIFYLYKCMSRPNTCASFDSNMEEENFRVNTK